MSKQKLDTYRSEFDRGRSFLIVILWFIVSHLIVNTWLPGSAHRIFLLRLFGAKIGVGVVIKNGVNIKFPWRLQIGNYSWIGEGVWIDNLDVVVVGSNSCISQGVYLCTGSHDWSADNFSLRTKSIKIGDGVWICAKAIVGPGVKIGDNVVLTLGSVASSNLHSDLIYSNAPIANVKRRC